MNKITATVVASLAGVALLFTGLPAQAADAASDTANRLEQRLTQVIDKNTCLKAQNEALRRQMRAMRQDQQGGAQFAQSSFAQSCR